MTYTISGFSDEISMDTDIQFEVLNKLGIKYFEPRGIDGKNISELTKDEAYALKEKMDKYGIKVSSIGSPIGKIDITDDFDAHMVLLSNVINIAKILDTKYIRVFSFFITDGKYEEHRDEVLNRMKKMAELAEKNDVILLHENEKGIYGDIATRCKDIFDNIKSKALGCVFDPANFVQCGEITFPNAWEMLRDNFTYMHIKDALFKDGSVVPAGLGDGHLKEILSDVLKMDGDVFFSLEPHLGSFEGLESLEINGDTIKLAPGGEGTFTLAHTALMSLLDSIK